MAEACFLHTSEVDTERNMAGVVYIDDAELTIVTTAINSANIDQIAMGFLGLSNAEVGTATAGAMGNQFQRVFNMLNIWRGKNSTRAGVNLKVLLYERLRAAAGQGQFSNLQSVEFLNQ